MEQTYLLGEDDSTLLWSDRTVKLFFYTVQKPPWVLVILRRNPVHGRGDTPPRGPQVTLDTVGTVISAPPMPASPRATPITTRDIIAVVILGLSCNRSVGRIKGNQATFDNSQRNNLRSCVWVFGRIWFGSAGGDVRADFSR